MTSDIGIRVLCFDQLRRSIGHGELELELAEGTTAQQAAVELARRYPQAASIVQSSRLAVGQDFVDGGQVLRDGDELAVLPPVSGG